MVAFGSPLFGRFKLPKHRTLHHQPFADSNNNNNNINLSVITSDDDLSNENTLKVKKKVRQRNGCFCCRKRRIKCKGSKPSCNNCIKASYLCVWPDGNESLPHKNDFKLIKLKNDNDNNDNNDNNDKTNSNNKEIIRQSPTTNPSSPQSLEILDSDSIIELPESEFLVNTDSNTLVKNKHKSSEIVEDELFRKFLIEINSSVISQVAPSLISFPWLLPQDSLLYDAFVHGFITDISPQLTHFKLQPASAFIPSLINDSMAQSLFCAAGAAFLYSSSKNIQMKFLAQEKFIDSANKFNNFISTNNIKKNSGNILLYLLLAYLKTRFIFEGQYSGTLAMISIIEAMKIWIKNKESDGDDDDDDDTTSQSNKIIEISNDLNTPINKDFNDIEKNDDKIDDKIEKFNEIQIPNPHDNYAAIMFKKFTMKFKQISMNSEKDIISSVSLKKSNSMIIDPTSVETEMFMAFTENVEIENKNKNIHTHKDKNLKNSNLLPFERTMIESFVFNYSNLIFAVERSLIPQVTSPFIMFDLLRPYLSVPIYKCAVPWMNHPVVGAALPIVELQAKVSWLGLFYPLNENNKKNVSKIRSIANFYTRPILPIDVHNKEPENVQKKLLESCYAAEFVAKAVYIYSTRLLYPEMDYNCDLIQKTVEQAYENLVNISVLSQIHMILGFAFAVVGSVAIKQKHRSYLIWKLKRLLEVFSVSSFETMLKFYEVAWSKTDDGTRDKGWDALLDPKAIAEIII